MRLKNIKLLLVSFFIVLGVILFILIFKNVNDEKKELDIVMEKVITNFDLLNKNINVYNKNRDKLVSSFDSYYLDMLVDDYDSYVNVFMEQEEVVNKIYDNVKKISIYCNGQVFSDSKVNNICNNYENYYEMVVNVYVSDLEKLNELIERYNQNNNGSLSLYESSKMIDYIDYNKDGEYLGRE